MEELIRTARRAGRRQCRRLLTVVATTPLFLPITSVLAQSPDAHTAARAATQSLLSDQDATALQRMLREWFSAFSTKNYAALGQYFSAPYTEIGNSTAVLPDMNAVRGVWVRTREALDGTSYSHTEAVAIRVIPRSATRALLNIHWRRVSNDGSTLSEGSEFYFATKVHDHWRFNGGMSQVLGEFGAAGRALCKTCE